MKCVLRPVMLALVIAVQAPATPSGNLPVLHAKVTHTVLQDFMGGCSLRCAFFWETLGGRPAKPAPELCDDDAMTGWMAPQDWRNSTITFRLPKNLPPECRDTPFYGLSFANGMIATLKDFHAHARVKTMTLSVNDKPVALLRLSDTWKWQDFHFETIRLNQGDIIALSIGEIYPGKDPEPPVITEIVLQGGH
jgi:hypothetical protein